MSDFVVSELAPHGVVRAGINLSNTLLVRAADRRVIRRVLRLIWRARLPAGSVYLSSSFLFRNRPTSSGQPMTMCGISV